jgi:23S rRNA (adenine2503-C2)-methyltransferase
MPGIPNQSAALVSISEFGAEPVSEFGAELSHDLETPAIAAPAVQSLFGLDAAALSALFVELGEKPYRGKQLAEALYRQRRSDLDDVTTLPKALRDKLTAAGWQIRRPRIVESFKSVDGTERYLIQTGAQTVETVWMPEEDDSAESNTDAGADAGDAAAADTSVPAAGAFKRATICVSSQVGCAVNCQFCLTAKLGLQRNLTAGEIAGQVVAVLERHRVELNRSRINLVFMGMGEPFLNYDHFMAAVRLLVNEVGIAAPRMTVSTSGIVPGILRYAQEPVLTRPRLAISLNAPNDEVRAAIMPINRKWPIDAVLDAVRTIPFKNREKITFEYVMLGGVTDQPEHADQVIRLLRRAGMPAMINLIAWNPGPGIAYSSPSAESVLAFQKRLIDAGIQTYVRRPRGRDIYAACGQLKRTTEAA